MKKEKRSGEYSKYTHKTYIDIVIIRIKKVYYAVNFMDCMPYLREILYQILILEKYEIGMSNF